MAKFTSETAKVAGSVGKRGPSKATPAFIAWMSVDGAMKAQRILMELDGEAYLDYFAKLAPYVFSRMPLEIEAKADVTITVQEPEWDADNI